MDQNEGEQEKGAVEAFNDLRDEVAKLRQGIELVYKMGQDAGKKTAPDYTPTLGEMQKSLRNIDEWFKGMMSMPVLTMTPMDYDLQMIGIGNRAADAACRGVEEATQQLITQTADLREALGEKYDAKVRKLFVCGVALVSVFATLVLPAILPLSISGMIVGLQLGRGNEFQAGIKLIQQDDPDMAQLYSVAGNVCHDLDTHTCYIRLKAGLDGSDGTTR